MKCVHVLQVSSIFPLQKTLIILFELISMKGCVKQYKIYYSDFKMLRGAYEKAFDQVFPCENQIFLQVRINSNPLGNFPE